MQNQKTEINQKSQEKLNSSENKNQKNAARRIFKFRKAVKWKSER
jgi:hypothetical protein